jgi:hypothetical protein
MVAVRGLAQAIRETSDQDERERLAHQIIEAVTAILRGA